ncbi:hypothetical protein VTN77DRAFT_3681 [Rasamsonia byssochlamydoides]|uniref:uncharacterized protein n=1 Tax=Rasamsonia byssochlamydoides TaxID=89139 RepID=UPI003741FBCB
MSGHSNLSESGTFSYRTSDSSTPDNNSSEKPRVNFIYVKQGFSPPCPLTVFEHHNNNARDKRDIFTDRERVTVMKLSPTVVVKFGPSVKVSEALHMLYVKEHTDIPVPEVLACYTTYNNNGPHAQEDGFDGRKVGTCTYIFTKLVDGETLLTAWRKYDGPTKARVTEQLKSYMEQLRGLGPSSYIGSVDGGPVSDMLLDQYDNLKGRYNVSPLHI